MKKLLSLAVVLVVAGASQTKALAGISIGISIGGGHRHGHRPPVVVHAPPAMAPCPLRVVVVDPCASHGHYYRGQARYCDYGGSRHHKWHRDDDHHGHRRHHRRHEHGYRH